MSGKNSAIHIYRVKKKWTSFCLASKEITIRYEMASATRHIVTGSNYTRGRTGQVHHPTQLLRGLDQDVDGPQLPSNRGLSRTRWKYLDVQEF